MKNSMFVWVAVGVLLGCVRAEEQLEPLLEDLLSRPKYEPVPPEQLGINMPQTKAECDETATSIMDKFAEIIPAGLRNNPQLVAVQDNILEKLEYCQDRVEGDMFMNLRTAILSGMFSGKVPLLEVPFPIQSQCLLSMGNEEIKCGEMKQSLCDFVNPLNGEAVEFGSQHIKDFAIEYADVAESKDACAAMSAVIEDPTALENAIAISHDAKHPVRNGIATKYIDTLDRAASEGLINRRARQRKQLRARLRRLRKRKRV